MSSSPLPLHIPLLFYLFFVSFFSPNRFRFISSNSLSRNFSSHASFPSLVSFQRFVPHHPHFHKSMSFPSFSSDRPSRFFLVRFSSAFCVALYVPASSLCTLFGCARHNVISVDTCSERRKSRLTRVGHIGYEVSDV